MENFSGQKVGLNNKILRHAFLCQVMYSSRSIADR